MQEGKLNPNEGKLKALQAAMAKIEKDFGKGSIMKLGDEHVENIEVIPTGSIALDNALGVGGYPKGDVYKRQHSTYLCRANRHYVGRCSRFLLYFFYLSDDE